MRPACPPLIHGCKFLNFSRSRSEMDLAGRRAISELGEAEAATALGDVVVIGRSYNGMGGSNPVPAARMGRPIVLGPDHHNFADMVEALLQGGAAVVEVFTSEDPVYGDRDGFHSRSPEWYRRVFRSAGLVAVGLETEAMDRPGGIFLRSAEQISEAVRYAAIELEEEALRGDVLELEFELEKTVDSGQLVTRSDVALASWVEASQVAAS